MRGNLTKWSCGGGPREAVTGRKICWCRRADSNRQPIAYEAIALPLSYCGVQNGPCIKLLSKKLAPVEEARSALTSPLSLPGLTRQSIPFELKRFFSMDARVKPGHDGVENEDGRYNTKCSAAWRKAEQASASPYLNSARMRLQPSAGGVAGSGAGSASVSPLGPGSSGACTSGITAGATAVISPARGARDSSAVAAAIARRPPRPPAEKGSA